MSKPIQFYDENGVSCVPTRVKVAPGAINSAADIDLTEEGPGGYVQYADADAGTVNVVQIPDSDTHLKDSIITSASGNVDIDGSETVDTNISTGFATTATAAGTTTLTRTSKQKQAFTGVTTQTVVLPVVTTLPQAGFWFEIVNNSTGALTVNSSGSNLVQTMAAGSRATFSNNKITADTTAAAWDVTYIPVAVSIPFTAASASSAASLAFAEDTDNGAHAVTVKAPASVAADVDVELPGVAGTLMRTAEVLRAYQSTNLSKTNNTFVDTELSVTVEAAGKYQVALYGFFTQANATGGVKFDLAGGTATLTSGLLQWLTYQADDNTVDAVGSQTALADVFTPGFAPESEKTFFIQLLGTMDVNAGGTIIVRFAQSVTDAGACVFLIGSSLVMVKI